MSKKKDPKILRWGFSTGACAAAVATAAWTRLERGETPKSIRLCFLDGEDRILPLQTPTAGQMAAIQKEAGDDPDCTRDAIIYANISPTTPCAAKAEDYTLEIGSGSVILRAIEGIGLCTRLGLDCEQGRWAINAGPRRMIAENLHRVGLDFGCWLLEIGVRNGLELAKHTLNSHLGIQGGISLLGTTGLVRPYSHEAYIQTVRTCVKSHHLSGGSTMVFCTGGRTKSGAKALLHQLPETAFVCIGDFIAESLAEGCRYGMSEIVVACMPGKLCKYASGFENTHAHKVSQDMALFCAKAREALPKNADLHTALENSVSVREALLLIPEEARPKLLRLLARIALEQFAHRCAGGPALRLLVFNFEGRLLFEEAMEASKTKTYGYEELPPPKGDDDSAVIADPVAIVGPSYFMQETPANSVKKKKGSITAGRIDVISCGVVFPTEEDSLAMLEEADTVYGSRTLLEVCPVELDDARPIGAKAREDATAALALCRAGRRVVVLASGDALYHGLGGTLADLRLDEDNVVYHPGITAFQALFHRLGLPWHDARLFCAHSTTHIPAREIAEAPLSVTYAGSRYPAHAIARAVLDFHPASSGRAAVMAERLGSGDERILSGHLADIAKNTCGPTSILVIFPNDSNVRNRQAKAADQEPDNAPIHAPVLALGLPDEEYERENNLITASDVRAVILSRLRLPAWGTLWDIGAGSGSVGLEAAALRPNLHVHAIERKPGRCALIERNRLSLGVANHFLYQGDARDAVLSPLPEPDRVFIGGGGKNLPALLTACLDRLNPGGLIVASSVTLESFAALLAWSPERRIGLCRLDLANENPIAGSTHHLKQRNTIHVFTFSKETTE